MIPSRAVPLPLDRLGGLGKLRASAVPRAGVS